MSCGILKRFHHDGHEHGITSESTLVYKACRQIYEVDLRTVLIINSECNRLALKLEPLTVSVSCHSSSSSRSMVVLFI